MHAYTYIYVIYIWYRCYIYRLYSILTSHQSMWQSSIVCSSKVCAKALRKGAGRCSESCSLLRQHRRHRICCRTCVVPSFSAPWWSKNDAIGLVLRWLDDIDLYWIFLRDLYGYLNAIGSLMITGYIWCILMSLFQYVSLDVLGPHCVTFDQALVQLLAVRCLAGRAWPFDSRFDTISIRWGRVCAFGVAAMCEWTASVFWPWKIGLERYQVFLCPWASPKPCTKVKGNHFFFGGSHCKDFSLIVALGFEKCWHLILYHFIWWPTTLRD